MPRSYRFPRFGMTLRFVAGTACLRRTARNRSRIFDFSSRCQTAQSSTGAQSDNTAHSPDPMASAICAGMMEIPYPLATRPAMPSRLDPVGPSFGVNPLQRHNRVKIPLYCGASFESTVIHVSSASSARQIDSRLAIGCTGGTMITSGEIKMSRLSRSRRLPSNSLTINPR